jgi:hypothetical protein
MTGPVYPAKFVSCMREHGVTVNTSGKGPIIETGGSSKSSATSIKAAFAACEPTPHSAPPSAGRRGQEATSAPKRRSAAGGREWRRSGWRGVGSSVLADL